MELRSAPPRVGPVAARAAMAVALAVAVYWWVVRGWGVGVPVIALVVAAVLLVPSARHVSGRVVINGSLAITVVPVLAAFPLPISLNPGALLAAVSVASLVLSVRRAGLLPAAGPIDLLVPAAAGVAALAVKDWLSAETPQGALVRLLPGADYSGHFDMFELLRQHGKTIADLGPGPDGSPWVYHGYPMGYHALCAMVADLMGRSSGALHDLVLFAQVNGVVVALGCTVLVAGLCSLPGLRSSPGYAAVAVPLVLSIVLTGVGGASISEGFVNFWLAAVLAATSVVVARLEDSSWAIRLVAVQCLLAGVAFAWFPVVVLAAPAVLMLGRRRRCRRLLLVVAPGMLVVAVAAAQILAANGSRAGATLNAAGSINQSPYLIVASGLLVVITAAFAAKADSSEGAGRWAWAANPRLLLVPVLGATVSTALAAFQLLSSQHLTYYFYKILTGVDLVLGVVLVVAVLAGLDRESAGSKVSQPSALLIPVGLVFLFCLGGFALSGELVSPSRQDLGTTAFSNGDSLPAIASDLSGAVRLSGPYGSRVAADRQYVPLGEALGSDPRVDQRWFLALTGTYTVKATARTMHFWTYRGPIGAAEAAVGLGPELHGLVLVTAPAQEAALRDALRSKGAEAALVAWR